MKTKIVHEVENNFSVLDEQVMNKETSDIDVVVVGLGYVGLPLAILLSKNSYRTHGFDNNTERIKALSSKKDGSFLGEETQPLKMTEPKLLQFEKTMRKNADIYIICVPTPVNADHTPDFEPLKAASEETGRNIKKGSLVVVESTINPGASRSVSIPILEETSGLKAGEDFYFVHCPERINPGDSYYNVENIPRVIGGFDDKSLEQGLLFYRSFLKAPVKPMNTIEEAEAVKMVENSFRDINIAFVNELAMSFDKAGIDIVNVIKGAETKPFGFMAHFPGCGVGGHCIPVDPYYLIRYGAENGFWHEFLITARNINNKMPHYTVDILEKALEKQGKKLKGSTITLLGLSYKKNIPDMRESPALMIKKLLIERGATVKSFDPHVPQHSEAKTLKAALLSADAVVLATDHDVFIENLTPSLLKKYAVPILIDGRNALIKDDFLEARIYYKGIGR